MSTKDSNGAEIRKGNYVNVRKGDDIDAHKSGLNYTDTYEVESVNRTTLVLCGHRGLWLGSAFILAVDNQSKLPTIEECFTIMLSEAKNEEELETVYDGIDRCLSRAFNKQIDVLDNQHRRVVMIELPGEVRSTTITGTIKWE